MIITGASGRLGSELKKLFPNALTPKYTELDITDRTEVGRYLTSHFDLKDKLIIIHCAAITDVKYAEDEPDDVYRTNSIGTFYLAEFVYRLWQFNFDIKLVYISTDHVFDGLYPPIHLDGKIKSYKDEIEVYGCCIGYDENNTPNPKGIYAKSKLMGEWYTLFNPNNLVIRTSFMKDFKFKGAFTDKYWSGLWVEDAAKMIAKAVKMDLKGLYHIAGYRTNIYDFVCTRYKVKPISLADNPINRSGLPYLKDTSLDTTKWKNALNPRRKKH